MNTAGVLEIDIHGMNQYQAEIAIDAKLKSAGRSLYRIRIIHGYHGGTSLKEMIRARYRNHPKVKRIEIGLNQGVTELVLRELL